MRTPDQARSLSHSISPPAGLISADSLCPLVSPLCAFIRGNGPGPTAAPLLLPLSHSGPEAAQSPASRRDSGRWWQSWTLQRGRMTSERSDTCSTSALLTERVPSHCSRFARRQVCGRVAQAGSAVRLPPCKKAGHAVFLFCPLFLSLACFFLPTVSRRLGGKALGLPSKTLLARVFGPQGAGRARGGQGQRRRRGVGRR